MNTSRPAVSLTSDEREALINAIEHASTAYFQQGAAPYRSHEERLAGKRAALHYQRVLDILLPTTEQHTVPIASLAPSEGVL